MAEETKEEFLQRLPSIVKSTWFTIAKTIDHLLANGISTGRHLIVCIGCVGCVGPRGLFLCFVTMIISGENYFSSPPL